jgi:hypothetical protein
MYIHTYTYIHTYVCTYIHTYIHCFKIIKEPTCPCGTAEQTTDHVIFDCAMLTKEREKLKTSAQQKDRWPTNKQKLLRKHYRDFVKFINDIPFDKLTSEIRTTN